MNEILQLNRLLNKLEPKLQELAWLAKKTMEMSGNVEEAVIFCIEPNPKLELLIAQLGCKRTAPMHLETLVTSFEDQFIMGIGDQGFAHFVSLLVKEESQEMYRTPASLGKVAGFLFSKGCIYRFEITPKPKTTH